MGDLQASGAPLESEERVAPERLDSWAWLARLRKPQGRKGEVWAEILTDFPEKFAERTQLWLIPEGNSGSRPNAAGQIGPRRIALKNHWLHKGGVVLHFEGVDSITDAEKLAGLTVAIPASERASLGEDEVYIDDLVGCMLTDVRAGQSLLVGPIAEVDRSAGPIALLVVKGSQGEVLVPFAKSFLRKLDTAAKVIEMDLPEGLVELNS